MGKGNRPTPEFRREAVRLTLTSGRTRLEIAADLGIRLSTLTRWLSQGRHASEPSQATIYLHAELKRLRQENVVMKHERDILKKPRPSSRGREIDEVRLHRCREGQLPDQSNVSRPWSQPERLLCVAGTACWSSLAAGYGLSGVYRDGLRAVERHLWPSAPAPRRQTSPISGRWRAGSTLLSYWTSSPVASSAGQRGTV